MVAQDNNNWNSKKIDCEASFLQFQDEVPGFHQIPEKKFK